MDRAEVEPALIIVVELYCRAMAGIQGFRFNPSRTIQAKLDAIQSIEESYNPMDQALVAYEGR